MTEVAKSDVRLWKTDTFDPYSLKILKITRVKKGCYQKQERRFFFKSKLKRKNII